MTSKLLREVSVSAEGTLPIPAPGGPGHTPLDELFTRLGHPPLTVKEWSAKAPDVFESDEELDEFIKFTRESRERFEG